MPYALQIPIIIITDDNSCLILIYAMTDTLKLIEPPFHGWNVNISSGNTLGLISSRMHKKSRFPVDLGTRGKVTKFPPERDLIGAGNYGLFLLDFPLKTDYSMEAMCSKYNSFV
ncbi:hypothetical protein CEXT_93041 [Caerostris extrusa]|uniref:Uncharacterized protein n=1 Tax=Caerostris extrusa TaxID=172846 RepID=A0AAV4MWJ9_CAEEX|nr:hypothetical protein CEXT_93041 [Caerostris extrusa]